MKQVLYFLVGFFFSIFVGLSYAVDCYDPFTDGTTNIDSMLAGMSEGSTNNDSGVTTDQSTAGTAYNDFRGSTTHDYSGGIKYYDSSNHAGFYWTMTFDGYDRILHTWPFSDGVQFTADRCVEDSDGDGLPDVDDMYPNDPNPYKVKLMAYYTDDGTESGTHVFEVWMTDRGDYYQIGEKPGTDHGFAIYDNSPWIDPTESTMDGEIGSGNPGDVLEQPVIRTGLPTGDSEADTDPTLEPGSMSDGTETDSESFTGIRDNTGIIAKNTKRQGEYLRDINKTLEEIKRDQNDLDGKQLAQKGAGALNAYDPLGGLSAVNGELIPETDYEEPQSLGDETFVSEFINSNPLKTVFDNSGFNFTSSSCTMTLNLGYLGSHVLDICSLEAGMVSLGNLLVAFSTLAGMIHLATGRGFK